MSETPFDYSIEPEKWPTLLTKELDGHFSRMGEESVQWDVSNHRYGTQEKHYAALYWLGQKRKARQRTSTTILVVAIATLVVSLVAWLQPGFIDLPQATVEDVDGGALEETQDPDTEGLSIVESEDFIACVATQAHWSGMEIVFVRQSRSNGERWLADGLAVQEVTIVNAIITGQALYTEYEEDTQHSVENKPYRFRLDIVKGTIDIWTFEHYGEKAGEGKAFHFNGTCASHEPAMSP